MHCHTNIMRFVCNDVDALTVSVYVSDKRNILLVNMRWSDWDSCSVDSLTLFCSVSHCWPFVRASLIMHTFYFLFNWHLIDLLTCIIFGITWGLESHTLCFAVMICISSHYCPRLMDQMSFQWDGLHRLHLDSVCMCACVWFCCWNGWSLKFWAYKCHVVFPNFFPFYCRLIRKPFILPPREVPQWWVFIWSYDWHFLNVFFNYRSLCMFQKVWTATCTSTNGEFEAEHLW